VNEEKVEKVDTVRYRCVSTPNAHSPFFPSHVPIRPNRSLLDCVIVCIIPPCVLRPPSSQLTDFFNRRPPSSQLRCATDAKTFASKERSVMRSAKGVSEIGEELFHTKRNITSTTEQFLTGMKDMMTTNHPTPIQLDCNGRGDMDFFSLSILIRLTNMKCDSEMMRHCLSFV